MSSKLYALIEAAFDHDAFEDAMVNCISDYIDYADVADQVLRKLGDEITRIAADIADDYI